LADCIKPCILPWINFSTNTFGRPRTCGYANQATVKANGKLKDSDIETEWNSEYFRKIRLEFQAGRWPENCSRCEYVESLGGRSKRLEENRFHLEPNQHLIDSTHEDGSVDYFPPQIDIRVGTICNLKCIHCGTGASSRWSQDVELIDKYPNTEAYNVDNKWIEQDSFIWDNIDANLDEIRRFNFLGGEPFANKQHNRFLARMAQHPRAGEITLSYVTNGLLITPVMVEQLSHFKEVIIRLSMDATEQVAEYFRFPTDWQVFDSKLRMMAEAAVRHPCIDLGVQWTCSNISMFYLARSYDYIATHYPSVKFLFCNHVEWPVHMSAQVLPPELKAQITTQLQSIDWGENANTVPFYIDHMNERDLWTEHGTVFMNYLDDLDRVRGISWSQAFAEMELERYDPRKNTD
jgi:MoaA/NifB/PqqE/SkfB family radical SAM enzyme